MRNLAFGEKPKNLRYAVIVCPKCKQHVQITETGKKSLKCQRCGAVLQTLKLRVFYSSEELSDAVDYRARLQAEISGKGYETFSLESTGKESEPENLKFSSKIATSIPEKKDKASPSVSPKKDQKLIFLGIIKTSGGKIEVKELRQKALEKGIEAGKFEGILEKLLETGELYSPEAGIIKLVK
ncbi:MAG: DUF5817 domain-containing protein [Methanosarcina sp.]